MISSVISRFLQRSRNALVLIVLSLLAISSFTPSARVSVFGSPDETATAVTANEIALHGRVFLPRAADENGFPWIHPRSWVGQARTIVPVGFLGWPLWLAMLRRLFGAWILPWVGGWVMASSAIPLYLLLRKRYSHLASLIGVIVTMTFPSMLLYANRGLFPNGPLLACALWVMWLLSRATDRGWSVREAGLIGTGIGITLSIRPVEAVWMIPWWLWAGWRLSWTRRHALAFIAGFVITTLPSCFLAWQAYGAPWMIGYWVREPSVAVAATDATASSSSFVSFLPFGFHPRNIWWNMHAFLVGLFWPWLLLLVCAIGSAVRRHRRFTRDSIPLALAAGTIVWLLVFYGSGLYADHVRLLAVTMGNSFVRYLLPLAPIIGWGAADVWEALVRDRRRLYVGSALLVALILFGGWKAFAADDEGLVFTRRELIRYNHIHAASASILASNALVISARSDKIFFPMIRAMSPVPSPEFVTAFAHASSHPMIALFARPPTQQEKDEWMHVGLDLRELASFGRESLYHLAPRLP